jgi:hypothetical protein
MTGLAASTPGRLSKVVIADLRRRGLRLPWLGAASDGAQSRRHSSSAREPSMTIATPRAMSRITAVSTAGLLALGSQRQATFPVSQWCVGLQLTDYSCGGSRGFGAR